MALSGTIVDAPRRIGFDTISKVSGSNAAAMVAQGYAFCLRYVSLTTTQGSNDLSTIEAQGILDAGLDLGIVQHATISRLTTMLGTTNGNNAATNAEGVGIPQGITLWCDLESVNSKKSQDTLDYVNAWASAVTKHGYAPGLYVGDDTGLNSSQLYAGLSMQHYWKSASEVPWVEKRGFQMIQGRSFTTPQGLKIDPDLSTFDAKQDRFKVLHPAS